MVYTKQQIKDILKKHKGAKLFSEKENIQKNARHPFFYEELEKISKIADDAMKNPSQVFSFSMYKEYEKSGEGGRYQSLYFERRKKLNALVLMACASGDDKYIPYIEDELWVWLNEFAWALPSHFDNDLLNPDGKDGKPHELEIELCAAENAYMMAEIDAVLGQRLSPFLRHRMEKETKRRVLSSFLNENHSFWWEFCDHNWAAVCGCSVAAAAMYYISDDDELAEIVVRIMECMERYLEGYNEDGACVEGVSYWCYGFSYFVFFSELLKERTEGEIDLMKLDKVHRIALYLQRARTAGNKVINFADSSDIFSYRICLLHKLKSMFPDVIVPSERYAMRMGSDHCFRWAGFIRDYTWFNEESVNDIESFERSAYFPDAQIYISHKNSACFAVTGGNNGYNHNHNDLGHFIYYQDGEDIFVDIGQGVYRKGYFDEKMRYDFINNSSKGHSVAQFGDNPQKSGSDRCAYDFEVIEGEDDIVKMQLFKAYDTDSVKSYTRRFDFAKDGSLTLTDSFGLTRDCDIIERFVVDVSEPPIKKDGFIVLKKNGVTLRLSYDKCFELADFNNLPYDLRSTHRSNGIYIISLTARNAVTEVVFKIEKI